MARTFAPGLGAACVVAAVVFGISLFGIYTRPLGFLAALWPANAVLLGLFVLRPGLAGWPGWVGAITGYLAAGYVSGDALVTNLWLTGANLAGVVTGFVLFLRLDPEDRALQRPLSVLHMLLISVAAAAASALVGAGLTIDPTLRTGLVFWFISELGNYVVVLPVLLTAPTPFDVQAFGRWLRDVVPEASTTMPIAALCLSVAASIAIGGPGAIAFPVPALLWCSLTYGLFPMSIIVMLSSLAMLSAEVAGLLFLPTSLDVFDRSTSFRLGITLVALGPLTVTTITVAQRRLLKRLDHAVSMDGLTNILARRAFLERSGALLARPQYNLFSGVAVLMIDIDHFKQVNDLHGHAVGDAVLIAVTDAIGGELRRNDLFGRIGGEEFAVTLPDITRQDAIAMAERLRHVIERLLIPAGAGPALRTTISIGIVHRVRYPSGGVIEMLPLADAALYQAKARGRNRIVCHAPPPRAAAAATG
ncbi:diguanylate cyclase [Kaistia sp. 32K]|nr:diguanylate cyclase [Kaistia sp. 32K]